MAHSALRRAQQVASEQSEGLASDLDAWKRDHNDAMRCRDREDRLKFIVELLEIVFGMDERRRQSILAGEYATDPDTESQIRLAFESLSISCTKILSGIEDLEKKEYAVAGSDDFRRSQRRVEEILAAMHRRLQTAERVGLTGIEFNQEAQETFDQKLSASDRPSRARPTGPLPVQVVDAGSL